jgi:hypothetical protein
LPCMFFRVFEHGEAFTVFRAAFAVFTVHTAKPCYLVVNGTQCKILSLNLGHVDIT